MVYFVQIIYQNFTLVQLEALSNKWLDKNSLILITSHMHCIHEWYAVIYSIFACKVICGACLAITRLCKKMYRIV